jgi:hypothetical protein
MSRNAPLSCPKCGVPFVLCGKMVRCFLCKADLMVGIASAVIAVYSIATGIL